MEPLVLIVDDNEKNLKLARDVLQAAGFRTLEAETGAEGIALAASTAGRRSSWISGSRTWTARTRPGRSQTTCGRPISRSSR